MKETFDSYEALATRLVKELYGWGGRNPSPELDAISKVRNTLWVGDSVSELPCDICNGPVVEFSIPSDIWNKVVRIYGKETDREYLCVHCFLNSLRNSLGLQMVGS